MITIEGVSHLPKLLIEDERGRFEKFFSLKGKGLASDLVWLESFSSVSETNTIRGMHLQAPPFEHHRLITCSEGEILDVCLDLRAGSPTFHRIHSEVLVSGSRHSLLVPPGVAHGFRVIKGPARVTYFSTAIYSEEHDTGIRWDSIGFNWGIKAPIISERDLRLAPLADFSSPFEF